MDPARKSWGRCILVEARMAVTITGSQIFGRWLPAKGEHFEKNRVFNHFSKHFRLETVKLLRVKKYEKLV